MSTNSDEIMSDTEDVFESDSSQSSTTYSESECDNSEDEITAVNDEEPYQHEPLASDGDEDDDDSEEKDQDGLSPTVLESRLERRVAIEEWCKCQNCHCEKLEDALEFRCCNEITNAIGKLLFDGSIERLNCITEHEDFAALINKTVLLQVAPLLRYRRQNGSSENEFIRAIAYRWIVRWICGYMGWDNRRPLSACIYHSIRTKYPSSQTRGYTHAQRQ